MYSFARTPYGRLALSLCAAFVLLITLTGVHFLSQTRLISPPPTLLFEDVRGNFLAEFSADEKRIGYWPLPDPLPSRIVKCTLAAEDSHFFSHPGVNPLSILRALKQNISAHRRVSGASTIAMQVARIQRPGDRTLLKKADEAITALLLVGRFGHERILRQYLKIAPYGNRNRGIAYAARRYLGKPVEDLTWAEASFLAAIPKLPGRMNIHRPRGQLMAVRRARWILARLLKLGWISRRDYREALTQLPQIRLVPLQTRPLSTIHAILAINSQTAREKDSFANRRKCIFRTTLDLDLQREVSWLAWKARKRFYRRGVDNVAVIVASRKDGRILSYVGSADYFDRESKGAIDYARIPRSSGSTLKPFIYGLGLTLNRYDPSSLLTDVGIALDPKSGTYVIKNFDDRYLGPILYRNALANSRNVPAMEVLRRVGLENAYRHFYDLGLVKHWKDPQSYGLGMALGSLHVTLFDLVRAYCILADEGLRVNLGFFPSDKLGKRERIIPEDTARQIALFLSDPMARLPSFHRGDALEYPYPVAVKTGTSKGFRDAWCVAWSGKYVVGVWMGNADVFPMNGISGANSAAKLVHEVMDLLHPKATQGLEDVSFPPPRGYVPKRIDLLSGKLALPGTPCVAVEWFKPGTGPTETTDVYRETVCDSRTGRPALPDCPLRFRERRLFVSLPPRFASWAKASGLELQPVAGAAASASLLLKKSPILRVRAPSNKAVVLPDPEVPAEYSTLRLLATVEPPVPQVVWYVDGRPFKVVDYPYSARWPIKPGKHIFQIRLPWAPVKSPAVRIRVGGSQALASTTATDYSTQKGDS